MRLPMENACSACRCLPRAALCARRSASQASTGTRFADEGKTKQRLHKADPELGDAYTFIAFERHHKLALAWHLGRRTYEDTSEFMGRLAVAARGKFKEDGREETWQLSTDGWHCDLSAID